MHLPVTILEVSAVSHVVCALVLYALWWHNPRKVDEPTIIDLRLDGMRPLVAFMLMCSTESKDQMLPGFQLEDEHSEMAGVKVLGPDPSSLQIVAKRRRPLGPLPDGVESLNDERRSNSSTKVSTAEKISAGGERIFAEAPTARTTAKRWSLAQLAMQQYPAVVRLLHHPPSDSCRKYSIALATNPEMPLRCRKTSLVDELDEKADWLECRTQHLVSIAASNWPHDGLLRTTSGLWIGASLWLVSIVFSGTQIAAWHADFPSELEAWL